MQSSYLSRAFLVLIALVAANSTFAAAQLKAGAKTSAQPTATNPQQRQIQITFDPDITPDAVVGTLATYSVTSFQLSVQFDSNNLSLADIMFVPPFTETPPPTGTGTQGGTLGKNYTVNSGGLIGNIAGRASATAVPADTDVNIFLADFVLNGESSLDTPLTFTIFANPQTGDFIAGTDPVTGQTITTPAAGVVPTTITLSFNQATTQVNATPLPGGGAAGLVTAGLLAAGFGLKRRLAAA